MKDLKFRCSSLSHLMTNDRSGKNIGETSKVHALDCYYSWKYKRHEEVYSKYIEKGNEVEEDSITLLSLLTKKLYFKNEDTFENDFIKGTPDLFTKDKSGKIIGIEDVKSSWDMFTFFRSKHGKPNKMYYWQMMGYMMLTGALEANIRYCLVNSTPQLIEDEKRKLAWAMRCMDDDSNPAYIEKCKMIERNMIYDIQLFTNQHPYFIFHNDPSKWKYDIPKEERMFTVNIHRDEDAIKRIEERVIEAREYLSLLNFKQVTCTT